MLSVKISGKFYQVRKSEVPFDKAHWCFKGSNGARSANYTFFTIIIFDTFAALILNVALNRIESFIKWQCANHKIIMNFAPSYPS